VRSGSRVRILVSFACVYVFWGSTYLAMRFGVEVLPPFVLGASRFLISGPLLLGICLACGVRIRPHGWREFWTIGLIGLLMLVGGNTSVIWSEQVLPSGLAALLVAAIPLFAALIEVVRPQGEGLRARGWVGIGVGFLGLVLLLWPELRKGLAGDTRQAVAAGILLLGTFSWTLASVISRRVKIGVSGFAAAGWEMLFAGVFDLGVLGATHGWHGAVWGRQAWAAVLYLVVFGSLITYTAYIYLLDHVAVSKVTTYAYVNPVIAVVLGAVFLGERFEGVEWFGMAGILVAVFLITSSAGAQAVDEDVTALPADQG
jgi:drug/metabolite transporter (DMT)-like permease